MEDSAPGRHSSPLAGQNDNPHEPPSTPLLQQPPGPRPTYGLYTKY